MKKKTTNAVASARARAERVKADRARAAKAKELVRLKAEKNKARMEKEREKAQAKREKEKLKIALARETARIKAEKAREKAKSAKEFERQRAARDKERAVANFRYFLYRDAVEAEWKAQGDYNMRTNLTADAIAPTRQFTLTDRRAVNDPLVHYTLEDLRPGPLWLVSRGAGKVPGLNSNLFGSNVKVAMGQRKPLTFAPWGKAPLYAGAAPSGAYATDPRFKDPGIQRSDDWDFPVHTLPTLGWLGRIHRGTPWQTVYLKSGIAGLEIGRAHV